MVVREAYWWRVRSVQTRKESYIPNSHVAKVYHGWVNLHWQYPLELAYMVCFNVNLVTAKIWNAHFPHCSNISLMEVLGDVSDTRYHHVLFVTAVCVDLMWSDCCVSWLFEGVERQKAEELLGLPGNRVGSFMVRESAKERGEYICLHRCLPSDLLVWLDCGFLLWLWGSGLWGNEKLVNK